MLSSKDNIQLLTNKIHHLQKQSVCSAALVQSSNEESASKKRTVAFAKQLTSDEPTPDKI